MNRSVKVGDKVSWSSSGGDSQGTVVRKQTKRTTIKSHEVAATKDDPQYIVKSGKSGKIAAHKAESLKKSS
jgi:Hypervirulence associated proteins TUDOR domain